MLACWAIMGGAGRGFLPLFASISLPPLILLRGSEWQFVNGSEWPCLSAPWCSAAAEIRPGLGTQPSPERNRESHGHLSQSVWPHSKDIVVTQGPWEVTNPTPHPRLQTYNFWLQSRVRKQWHCSPECQQEGKTRDRRSKEGSTAAGRLAGGSQTCSVSIGSGHTAQTSVKPSVAMSPPCSLWVPPPHNQQGSPQCAPLSAP